MQFKDKIKELRKEKGWTQQQLADRLEVKRSTVAGYETGRQPDYNMLVKIANIFDTTVDYLVGATNLRSDPRPQIKQALENNPELMQFWEQISNRDDLQLLFKQTQNLSPESIQKVVEFMQMIENEHHKEG